MSSPNNTNQTDYDQNLLAEKYIKVKGLSDDNSTDKHLLSGIFDADNIIRLVKRGLEYLNYNIPVECALDVGCGEGNICRVLIKEKLAKDVVGIDKSSQMINYAKTKFNDDITSYQYILGDAVTDDFPTLLGKKFPVIVQTYMLCHAEDVDQLSRMISNIAQVSCGIFVGLIPSPYFDYSSDAAKTVSKYGIKITINDEKNLMKDGMKYQVTLNHGTSNEFTLIDHFYTPETYERIFKQAGFKLFEWAPVQLDRNRDDESLIDLVDSNSVIGFIASITEKLGD